MASRAIIILSVAAAAFAASLNDPVAIISQSQDISPDGSFHVKYETADGITFDEQGVLKNAGQKDVEAEEIRGTAGWTAPDGQKISLSWIADENGANFQGTHLPTPPPPQEIPVLIQRALDWIAAHPYVEDKKKF